MHAVFHYILAESRTLHVFSTAVNMCNRKSSCVYARAYRPHRIKYSICYLRWGTPPVGEPPWPGPVGGVPPGWGPPLLDLAGVGSDRVVPEVGYPQSGLMGGTRGEVHPPRSGYPRPGLMGGT